MKRYLVRVWSGTTEYRTVVRARNLEEGMEQALVILKIPFESVIRMESKERP